MPHILAEAGLQVNVGNRASHCSGVTMAGALVFVFLACADTPSLTTQLCFEKTPKQVENLRKVKNGFTIQPLLSLQFRLLCTHAHTSCKHYVTTADRIHFSMCLTAHEVNTRQDHRVVFTLWFYNCLHTRVSVLLLKFVTIKTKLVWLQKCHVKQFPSWTQTLFRWLW